jgi:endonuclease YncB( thermonuclease family)
MSNRYVLSLALALFLGVGAATASLAGEQLRGPVDAEVVRVVDGDTIEVRALIWFGQSVDVRVRINGVDAPEMEARCADERRRALQARDYLVQRVGGGYVRLSSVVYDKYGGRVRAIVSDGGGDVGSALIAKGLARPYHGERRQSWCAET